MKKNVKCVSCIILISSVLLLGACSVNSNVNNGTGNDAEKISVDRQDIPLNSEEFNKIEHEVYEANFLDELLKKHTSVIFDMTEAPENDYGWKDYYYITKDVCYCEMADGAEYSYDRIRYRIDYDRSGNKPKLEYGVELSRDFDLLKMQGWQIPPEDSEDRWFRNENEEHVACYIEDGLLYLKDRNNEESSKEWFELYIPNETYSDEIVYTEVVADEETKEITEFNSYLESKDGTMNRVKSVKVFYDEEEPRRVSSLRSVAERDCENMVDVMFVADPGTDHEFSQGITIPIGSTVTYYCDNQENSIIFDDPEAAKLTHWDGLKSKTFYVFTEPTEEQTARYKKLLEEIR